MLPEILAHKRRELSTINRSMEIVDMQRQIDGMPPVISIKSHLLSVPSVSIIAEIKRRSPSKGQLVEHLDIATTVRQYEQAGASAISVLTDEKYFEGSLADLQIVRKHTSLPVLRKDFIIDEYQVYQSRVIGADAILLIVAALTPSEFINLHSLAHELGLEVLTEVHNEDELKTAIAAEVEIIGINNRDLNTFNISLSTTERLRPLIPIGIVCVAESGIHSRGDMLRMEQAQVDAVLVGESLMVSDDPVSKIHQLLGKGNDAH